MKVSNDDKFYTNLPVNKRPLSELLVKDDLFYQVPGSWHVVITDVKNSTTAIVQGRHEIVNLVATGSIVAVLNIARKANLTVPFFFGGDGATFIVPHSILDSVMKALLIHQKNTSKNFNLHLRVGQVPVAEIYERHHSLRISKLKTSQLCTINVLLGDGLMYADEKIKRDDFMFVMANASNQQLDLSGMQCRWQRIMPPANRSEVVSLLAIPQEGAKQSIVLKKVIDCIDTIYGEPKTRVPIRVTNLRLKATLAKIGLEMQARIGGFKLVYLLSNWLKTRLGQLYFKTKKGKLYLNNLIDTLDTLIIDGRISTVISGTQEQRKLLQHALDELERQGEIHYGLHVSKESVMSCYVLNLNKSHIHFVDGAEGGYTKAARMIKRKMNMQSTPAEDHSLASIVG